MDSRKSEVLNIQHPVNVPIREMHQDSTVIQLIEGEEVEYTECKDVYVFASGVVVILRVTGETILNSAAGPIKINRTGNDPATSNDFNELNVI